MKEQDNMSKKIPYKMLFSFADSLDHILMFSGTIAAVGNGMCMPLMAMLLGDLIDSAGQTASTKVLVHGVCEVSLKFVYLALGSSIASFFQVACWMVTGERQAAQIRGLYLKTILRQDIGFFDNETSTGEIVERMSGDTILIQDAMGEKAGKFIQMLSSFIGGFVMAFVKGWLLTLVMLSSIPPLVISGALMIKLIGKLASSRQTAYSLAATIVEQTIGAIRTVFLALTMSAVGIAQSSSLAPDVSKTKNSAASVFRILDQISRIDSSNDSGMTLGYVKGQIEFRHVSFKYPTRPDIEILRNLSLTIRSGYVVGCRTKANDMDGEINTEPTAASTSYSPAGESQQPSDDHKKDLDKIKKEEGSSKTVPFYKLFSFADSTDILLMVVGTIAAIGNGICMPLMALLFGSFVNSFGDNANTKQMVDEVSKVSLKFLYLAIGSGAAGFFQVICWIVTGERQAARIRSLYLKTILRQDIGFFDKETHTGEIIERMSGDTVLIQDAMGEKVGKLIQLLSTFIGGFAVAFTKGWLLTLVMSSSIPALVVAGAVMTTVIAKLALRGQTAYSLAATVAEQTIGAIRTVKIKIPRLEEC
ncbi:hypothetical protein QYF36_007689 [Acer negundo]|nr:hypothetical protein QYF36_007689 [Acer negundo]